MTYEEAEAMTYQDYVKEDEGESGWDRVYDQHEEDEEEEDEEIDKEEDEE